MSEPHPIPNTQLIFRILPEGYRQLRVEEHIQPGDIQQLNPKLFEVYTGRELIGIKPNKREYWFRNTDSMTTKES